ncbi:helix-turn-helix domain-containing protein [Janibacter hoylei]|uniref:helix-turn-helix domain-containing protein n=1 Tax=Janibacter hoylei TaxID=364298 RepID=UPI0021A4A175|nr:helix-turn-helix domain-containing protein [Janibacter hoylei]MCT1619303.1 helix-turn-helix domain-containing protein [Janibacter hoylei]MCT2294202.1 helix-turn-helix domain-containing protein [Janibacter hoylei]
MKVPEKMLMTVAETAEVLNVGKSAVYDLIRMKRLPSVKIGRLRRIPVTAVEEYVAAISEDWSR